MSWKMRCWSPHSSTCLWRVMCSSSDWDTSRSIRTRRASGKWCITVRALCILFVFVPEMSDSPVDDYIMSYGGKRRRGSSFVELFGYLFWETALVVAGLYLVVGLLIFIVNRKWKLIWLPFLYAILGGVVGVVYGSTLCTPFYVFSCAAAALAAIYISVPYSLSKRRTFYLSIMQACIICYCKLSRNNRISSILVV